MDDINNIDTFKQLCGDYGYGGDFHEVVEREFARMKGITYLDHAAATLYPESAVKEYYQDISRNVYGNPHSRSSSSRLTHDTIERVRYRILQHFNADPEEYCVIFTSGCTAALKLVAESFPWTAASGRESASRFCHLTDNHTSAVGVRGPASDGGAVILPVTLSDVENGAQEDGGLGDGDGDACLTPHLFCYPAQSNFSGHKYPLDHVKAIQARRLYPACKHPGRWFVLLDAASYVSCSPLDLRDCPADFIPISFYKMFGFPTGLGALLASRDAAGILKKTYFGGGSAAAYLSGEDYYVQTESISDRFEDGTVSFLEIVALNHSFEALYRITGGMTNIQQHTFGLARYTYTLLSSLCHGNGRPVARIYTEGQFESPLTQGALLNFNLIDSRGQIIGYTQVDRMAALYDIHVRTGCFCNTGACQSFLGISNQQIRRNLEAGHVCGDAIDLVDGRPTGSVRASFGYMSTFEDCQRLLSFIAECFVEKPVTLDRARLEALKATAASQSLHNNNPPVTNHTEKVDKTQGLAASPEGSKRINPGGRDQPYTLTNIYIYPIKSCAAFQVSNWPVGPQGLLHDRGWMAVNGNGVCLSQKREPRLCLVRPQVHLPSNKLLLRATGMEMISVPLEGPTAENYPGCQRKVCGHRVETVDCGDEAAAWLSEFLGQPCRLIKQNPNFTRDKKERPDTAAAAAASTSLSLVNVAQYLMINRASVEHVRDLMRSRLDGSEDDRLLDADDVISRFRANMVFAGVEPFEEDKWSRLLIGNTRFTVGGPCGRCQMIGVDQDSGNKTKEPLVSLSSFRSGKVTFGVYLTHHLPEGSTSAGLLSVGSLVHVEARAPAGHHP